MLDRLRMLIVTDLHRLQHAIAWLLWRLPSDVVDARPIYYGAEHVDTDYVEDWVGPTRPLALALCWLEERVRSAVVRLRPPACYSALAATDDIPF